MYIAIEVCHIEQFLDTLPTTKRLLCCTWLSGCCRTEEVYTLTEKELYVLAKHFGCNFSSFPLQRVVSAGNYIAPITRAEAARMYPTKNSNSNWLKKLSQTLFTNS
jgi:hypothetical protein